MQVVMLVGATGAVSLAPGDPYECHEDEATRLIAAGIARMPDGSAPALVVAETPAEQAVVEEPVVEEPVVEEPVVEEPVVEEPPVAVAPKPAAGKRNSATAKA